MAVERESLQPASIYFSRAIRRVTPAFGQDLRRADGRVGALRWDALSDVS
jgi:hypothetical protein